MFLWDYLITLGMEIELVWPSKWTVMKSLYLFQRYIPFLDTIFLGLYRELLIFYGFELSKMLDRNYQSILPALPHLSVKISTL